MSKPNAIDKAMGILTTTSSGVSTRTFAANITFCLDSLTPRQQVALWKRLEKKADDPRLTWQKIRDAHSDYLANY